MTISYNWLSEYLPRTIEPEALSKILTAIGLEVESLEAYESIKGGLKGLVIGEVLTCEQHPNADKLKVTTVNVGGDTVLQVVCGAANVAAGQKVVVATVGTTIYPVTGEPLTMKVAKIRGVESHGMICAEDEIGVGTSHDGIMVLPADAKPGQPAADFFSPYSDWIYEIGLTPNRMDAMSHLGVAKDVCAYLTHHEKETKPVTPFSNEFKVDNNSLPIRVKVENTEACPRYAGVSISGVTVQESPAWLKNRLMAIGQRPINNIVDITNYILHETGQPLHAFNADAITGGEVIVKNMAEGTSFITLDEKERKLSAEDLMICNTADGMCIAGVFGGTKSGVNTTTKNIFLESAWFHPVSIRKTSLRHGLRTEAATRFEKGVDISNCVQVLQRAALLIKEVAGGVISSDVVDVYPQPQPKKEVAVKYHYIKKLSGKNYHPENVKRILKALGFEVTKEDIDELTVAVPYSKPDISIPADIVEEIIRIDGLDNIEIPTSITISPAVEQLGMKEALKDKIAGYLVGLGFVEILTNSITNSKYFSEEVLGGTVKMINNLSAELDVLRPSMLETGLETIAYNLNRKNQNLQLFEFGKTYATTGTGEYAEAEHLCIYLTGQAHEAGWKEKPDAFDIYYGKGIAKAIVQLAGISSVQLQPSVDNSNLLVLFAGKIEVGTVTEVEKKTATAFDIKQTVVFVDIDYAALVKAVRKQKIVYQEVSKFPAMQRDLAMVVNSNTTYAAIETVVQKLKLSRLQDMRLFDVFESDKLGAGKKSMAISFTFVDEEKTLTDKEADAMMGKLVQGLEKELGAEIRK
ncbi:phenylalanine--tRNA ligase subunit beta [Sediminibacterium sp.]|uniref:phenylalanine--tRNA ligase subunit beta n=1 Tax=Sediminibacterium sp. TaxID=1917865 RepID=UPI0025FFBC6E|nr:phenylalanine--tRNA ligase subunit beta [Sediminibacterium sp.]MBW0178828.1 phenylalanine--tRNA ligase subunit beta [Sediminibacterium sp.]